MATKQEIAQQLVAQSSIKHPRQIKEAINRICKHTKKEIDYALTYLEKGVEPGYVVRVLTGILCK